MTIRVFLLNGHEFLREGLRAVLEREHDMEIVGEADSAVDGLRWVETTRPDVVLAGLVLSDGDGVAVCRSIKERAPGVVLTNTTSHVLVRVVRFVANGGTAPNLVRPGRLDAHPDASVADAGDVSALKGLTPQEQRLLDHLAEGLTNPQIATRMDLAEKTVKNYVSNLLRKLNMRSRTEAAVFVTNLRVGGERRGQLTGGVATPT